MYNINGRKVNREYLPLFYILLPILLKIVLVNLLNSENLRIIKSYNSEIHLIIQGTKKTRNLLSEDFKFHPSKVFVNGHRNYSCNKTCYLPRYKNKNL